MRGVAPIPIPMRRLGATFRRMGPSSDFPRATRFHRLEHDGPVGVVHGRDGVRDVSGRVAPEDALARLGVARQQIEGRYVVAKLVLRRPEGEAIRSLSV